MASEDRRLRGNLLRGTLASSLSSGTTSTSAFNSATIATLVDDYLSSYGSGNLHLAITLGNALTGAEIVYVTNTNLPTNNDLTILRGQEGTTAATWPSGTVWTVAPTMRDFPQHFGGVYATPGANSNPSLSNTSGAWATLPSLTTTNSTTHFNIHSGYKGDLVTVYFSIMAKVTSGSDTLALDIRFVDSVTLWYLSESSGSSPLGMVNTSSTTYTRLSFQGTTRLKNNCPYPDLLSIAPVYKSTGAGNLGVSSGANETNVPVMFGGSISVQGLNGFH